MKKISNLAFALSGLYLAGASFLLHPASAQQQPPSDAPPQKVPLDDKGNDETVTHLDQGKVKQTIQNVDNGGQKEIRVTNDVGTYIVKPNHNVGTSMPGDAQSNSNNPVQWVVKSWGGSKNSEKPDNDSPPTLQPNPSAPEAK